MSVLVDARVGHSARTLSDKEVKALSSYLDVLRQDDAFEVKGVIGTLIDQVENEKKGLWPARDIQTTVAWELSCENALQDGTHATIVCPIGNGPEEITNKEYEVLTSTLKVLRYGSWFAEWFSLEVRSMVMARNQTDRNPSPLTIMESLTDEVEQFENRLSIVRQLAEQHPDDVQNAQQEHSRPFEAEPEIKEQLAAEFAEFQKKDAEKAERAKARRARRSPSKAANVRHAHKSAATAVSHVH